MSVATVIIVVAAQLYLKGDWLDHSQNAPGGVRSRTEDWNNTGCYTSRAWWNQGVAQF